MVSNVIKENDKYLLQISAVVISEYMNNIILLFVWFGEWDSVSDTEQNQLL